MQSLFYVTSLAVATFLWGYLFYKKDYHPQPLKVIAQICTAGALAIVPIFGYKYIYQNWMGNLAEYVIFSPFVGKPLLTGSLFFILNLALLSLLLFGLSGLLSVAVTLWKHETFANMRSAFREEALGFTTASVLLGLLLGLEKLAESITQIRIVQTVLGTILALSVIEEYIKHLIVRFVDDKKLKDVDDAITLSIMVGLALAAVESVVYAYLAADLSLIMYRILISIPIHIVASGIFGYYYGLAHFAEPILQTGKKQKKWLAKALSLKTATVYREEKIVEGLFLATLFHTLNNLLLETNLAFLAVPLIVFGLTVLFHLYQISHLHQWALKAQLLKKKRVSIPSR